jgi:uncharacterized protein (TIGR03067 family)
MRHACSCIPPVLRFALFAAAPLLLWGSAIAQDKGKEKPVTPQEKLQGIWSVTELMEAGNKAPDEKAQSLRIEFKGKAITISIKDKAAIKGTFTVDAEKSPATMSISYESDGKEVTIPAIYELKGDDLKICHPNAEGGERPTAIESSASTVLMTLKRTKS